MGGYSGPGGVAGWTPPQAMPNWRAPPSESETEHVPPTRANQRDAVRTMQWLDRAMRSDAKPLRDFAPSSSFE